MFQKLETEAKVLILSVLKMAELFAQADFDGKRDIVWVLNNNYLPKGRQLIADSFQLWEDSGDENLLVDIENLQQEIVDEVAGGCGRMLEAFKMEAHARGYESIEVF